MKRFLKFLMVAVTCMSLLSPVVAEAKRFGGGGSFGKNRPVPTKQTQKAPEASPKQTSSGASKWLGPLAGLAIGAGLASMFAGGGLGAFGNAIGTILMALAVAGLVMFLIAKIRKSQQPNMQYAGAGAAYNAPQPVREAAFASGSTLSSGNIPHDFPVDSFLRNSKMSFIRLQAANDRKDINDVREYTTPEIFAEISMQMQERGNTEQTTEIVSINAELLEVANDGEYTIASVRFTGQLRENNAMLENIDEVWHIQRDASQANSTWLLAGVQQVNIH